MFRNVPCVVGMKQPAHDALLVVKTKSYYFATYKVILKETVPHFGRMFCYLQPNNTKLLNYLKKQLEEISRNYMLYKLIGCGNCSQ